MKLSCLCRKPIITFLFLFLSFYSFGHNTFPILIELKNRVLTQERVNHTPFLSIMANSVNTAYIYGYNNTLVTAEVLNAKSNEIFFDSYEESGSWDGVVLDNAKSHAGSYSARIDNNTTGEITYHSTKWLNIALTTPTKFKYSGWIYSTGPSAEIFLFMKTASETGYFTYVDAVPMNEINKWVYVEKEYIVPANITKLNIRIDNNNAGTVWFDDIRLHPSGAQMTTYTYDPMVGMTSKCDINNRLVCYEYDGFGRLTLIRDENKNILKKYCYNYQGQSDVCSYNIIPKWLATGTTRCKPCPSNGSYLTNIQQHEERDNNPYSSTYSTSRWIDDGISTNCVITPDWQQTGLVCEQNAGKNTGNQIKTETDMNPCSSAGTRTTIIQNCNTCPKVANWQQTGNYRCVKDASNINTGYQEREEKNVESCSSTYNQLRWVSNGYSATACPIPCNSSTCSGNNRKCVNGICETGTLVVISSVYQKVLIDGLYQWRWVCTRKYCFTDGTTSTYSEQTYNTSSCAVTACAVN